MTRNLRLFFDAIRELMKPAKKPPIARVKGFRRNKSADFHSKGVGGPHGELNGYSHY